MKYLLLVISTILIVEIINMVLTCTSKHIKIKNDIRREEYIISVLQEIAYDYHVRIIKAGPGSFISPINDEYFNNTGGCFELGPDNDFKIDKDFQINFNEKGTFYFINFRVLGKCYLAYAINPVLTWINAIKKARSENKKIFNRYKS